MVIENIGNKALPINCMKYSTEFCLLCDEAKATVEKSIKAIHHEVEFWNESEMKSIHKFVVVENLNAVIKYLQGFNNCI